MIIFRTNLSFVCCEFLKNAFRSFSCSCLCFYFYHGFNVIFLSCKKNSIRFGQVRLQTGDDAVKNRNRYTTLSTTWWRLSEPLGFKIKRNHKQFRVHLYDDGSFLAAMTDPNVPSSLLKSNQKVGASGTLQTGGTKTIAMKRCLQRLALRFNRSMIFKDSREFPIALMSRTHNAVLQRNNTTFTA